ncbi:universal stress protein [Pseudohalocynthiibacter sp. F2068]|jgi:nucleotide-binding universal stress UspA family protein|nr:universal stress protein [Pseudohalocynthiibacter sp. F2068]MCK0102696.1 universal stress protein [Pseudohalocynthiibacter sp. F2068]
MADMAKIIALVDGSVYSESVCDYAAWVALRKDASVEVMHVLGRRDEAKSNLSGNIGLGARTKLMDELADLDAQKAKFDQQRGRAILEDAEARLRSDGVEHVTTRLRHGDLIEELLLAEKDADLVVIGKRGEAADFATLHLGSNLERVVRASRIPVLVTSRAFSEPCSFLLAFDGGKSAMKAVEHVAKSKVFAGLNAQLLTVDEPTTVKNRALEGAAATLKNAGYVVESTVVKGDPEAVISERCKSGRFDMLVMGAYGHSRIRSLIIGSTTTEMVRLCQIPVLLFR